MGRALRWLGRPTSRRAVLALVDQAVASATNFLTGVVVGRALAQEQFGLYMLCSNVFGIALAVQTALIARPLTVFVPRLEGREHARYLGSALIQQLALTAVGALALFGVGATLLATRGSGGIAPVLVALSVAWTFLLVRELVRQISFAQFQMMPALALDLIVFVLQLGGVLLLAWSGTITAARTYLAGGVACAVGAGVWLATHHRRFDPSFERARQDFARNWSLGRWLLASHAISMPAWHLVPWSLFAFHGPAVVGAYYAASVISSLAFPITAGMSNVIVPMSSHALSRGGRRELNDFTKRSSLKVVIPVGGVLVVVALAGGWIVEFVYGAAFSGLGLLVTILSIQPLISAVMIPTDSALLAIERADIVFKSELVRAVLGLAVGVPLVIFQGLIGAGIALTLMVLSGAIYRWVAYWHLCGEGREGPVSSPHPGADPDESKGHGPAGPSD